MPVLNIAKNLKLGTTQVLRVMHRLEQVWPPVPVPAEFCDDFERVLVSWLDDFERADGPIGANWIEVPENPYYGWDEVPLTVHSGAAISPESTGGLPDEFGGGLWHEEIVGSQVIEVCVTGLTYGSNYPAAQRMTGQIRLMCQVDAVLPTKEELWVEWSDQAAVGGRIRYDCYPVLDTGEYHDESTIFVQTSPWAPALADPTVCLKLEAFSSGLRRIYMDVGVDGATTLIGEAIAPLNNVGPFVGFRMMWFRTTVGGAGTAAQSPRVLWARGGALSGEIGPNWEQLPYGTEPNHSTWLSDGESISETNAQLNTPYPGIYAHDHLLTVAEFGSGPQWAEIEVDNLWLPVDQQDFGLGLTTYSPRAAIHLNVDPVTHETNTFEVATNYTSLTEFQYFCYLSPRCGETNDPTMFAKTVPAGSVDETTVIRMRFESDGVDTLRAYLDGELILLQHTTGYEGGPANGLCQGTRIGLRAMWSGQAVAGNPNPVPTIGPRILSFCGGVYEEPDVVPWCDFFARADGDIGPDWEMTGNAAYSQSYLMQIDDGDAVGVVSGTGSRYSSGRYVESFLDQNQYVEAELSFGTHSVLEYIEIYTRLSDDFTNINGYVYRYDSEMTPGHTDWYYGIGRYDSADNDWVSLTTETGIDLHSTFVGDPFTLRLESDLSGAHRLYANGELLCSAIDTTYSGPHVGISFACSSSGITPRAHRVCGGPLVPEPEPPAS